MVVSCLFFLSRVEREKHVIVATGGPAKYQNNGFCPRMKDVLVIVQ